MRIKLDRIMGNDLGHMHILNTEALFLERCCMFKLHSKLKLLKKLLKELHHSCYSNLTGRISQAITELDQMQQAMRPSHSIPSPRPLFFLCFAASVSSSLFAIASPSRLQISSPRVVNSSRTFPSPRLLSGRRAWFAASPFVEGL
ncbi:hypothetical protein Droror1_Dr00015860 [Drosera rotundifolia]